MNQIQTLLSFIQSETQLTLDALQQQRLLTAAIVTIGVVFLLQMLLTLWVVRRLRDVSQLGERVSRLGDGLALLTDTTDAGLSTVLRQVEHLGRRPAGELTSLVMDLDVDRRALMAVSAGGVLGALARYAISVTWPGTPWATWVVNVSGCFLIGALYTLVHRRLPRLFVGTGVLGGYTTFSTATVQVPQAGLGYLAATLVGTLLAAWAGSALASVRRR